MELKKQVVDFIFRRSVHIFRKRNNYLINQLIKFGTGCFQISTPFWRNNEDHTRFITDEREKRLKPVVIKKGKELKI
jgi:hypothetical protein